MNTDCCSELRRLITRALSPALARADYLGPRLGIRSVRLASIVGSIRALDCRCVVVVVVVVVAGVVVVVVVVQPTIATIQTPKTTGINFFMATAYQNTPGMSRRLLAERAAMRRFAIARCAFMRLPITCCRTPAGGMKTSASRLCAY